MNFLNPSGDNGVERPCSQLVSYPLQCFQELFFATPAFVGSLFVGIGGFAIAVIIWGAIFALALFALLFVLKHLLILTQNLFQNTRFGRRIVSMVPFKSYLQKFCCRAQEVQPKKLINTQALGDYGANIVSKVHVDSRWFRNLFRSLASSKNDTSDQSSATRNPNRTPQRSTSRISALTPKILSPKSPKQ